MNKLLDEENGSHSQKLYNVFLVKFQLIIRILFVNNLLQLFMTFVD